MLRLLTAAGAALTAGAAAAHPGHGAPAVHTHVEELIAVALAVCIAFAGWRVWRAR